MALKNCSISDDSLQFSFLHFYILYHSIKELLTVHKRCRNNVKSWILYIYQSLVHQWMDIRKSFDCSEEAGRIRDVLPHLNYTCWWRQQRNIGVWNLLNIFKCLTTSMFVFLTGASFELLVWSETFQWLVWSLFSFFPSGSFHRLLLPMKSVSRGDRVWSFPDVDVVCVIKWVRKADKSNFKRKHNFVTRDASVTKMLYACTVVIYIRQ